MTAIAQPTFDMMLTRGRTGHSEQPESLGSSAIRLRRKAASATNILPAVHPRHGPASSAHRSVSDTSLAARAVETERLLSVSSSPSLVVPDVPETPSFHDLDLEAMDEESDEPWCAAESDGHSPFPHDAMTVIAQPTFDMMLTWGRTVPFEQRESLGSSSIRFRRKAASAASILPVIHPRHGPASSAHRSVSDTSLAARAVETARLLSVSSSPSLVVPDVPETPSFHELDLAFEAMDAMDEESDESWSKRTAPSYAESPVSIMTTTLAHPHDKYLQLARPDETCLQLGERSPRKPASPLDCLARSIHSLLGCAPP